MKLAPPADPADHVAWMSSRHRRLALLHLHQRSSPLDARESLTAVALDMAPRSDVVVLATCHRIEVYGAVPAGAEPRPWFAARLGTGAGQAALALDQDVTLHLFRAACGLDSAIRGEGQILRQIRRAYDAARDQRRLDPLLADLFQATLRLGRDLRATTALGSVRRSIGSLAVDEGIRLVADAERATALVVGAGEIGKLAARALRHRVGHLLIANRDPERARAVAADIGAEALPLDAIDEGLFRADLVISAASTDVSVLAVDRLASRLARGPLVVIDIAVPRSVGAAGRTLRGLLYRDVDDLGGESEPGVEEALAFAERRCLDEAEAFGARLRSRDAVPTIRALRERAERLRRAQLERAMAKLGHLDERDRRVVEALASSLTNALLHAPTVALQRAPERSRLAEELFDLSPAREGRGAGVAIPLRASEPVVRLPELLQESGLERAEPLAPERADTAEPLAVADDVLVESSASGLSGAT